MKATDQRCPDCRGEGYRDTGKRDLEPCDLCGGSGWLDRLDAEIARHERNGRGSRI